MRLDWVWGCLEGRDFLGRLLPRSRVLQNTEETEPSLCFLEGFLRQTRVQADQEMLDFKGFSNDGAVLMGYSMARVQRKSHSSWHQNYCLSSPGDSHF